MYVFKSYILFGTVCILDLSYETKKMVKATRMINSRRRQVFWRSGQSEIQAKAEICD